MLEEDGQEDSILLSSAQSPAGKTDKLNCHFTSQQDISECCAMILTETWVTFVIPVKVVKPLGFSLQQFTFSHELTLTLHRMNRRERLAKQPKAVHTTASGWAGVYSRPSLDILTSKPWMNFWNYIRKCSTAFRYSTKSMTKPSKLQKHLMKLTGLNMGLRHLTHLARTESWQGGT